MARETTIRDDGSSDSGDDFDDGGHEPPRSTGRLDSSEPDDELRPSRLEDVIGQLDGVEMVLTEQKAK